MFVFKLRLSGFLGGQVNVTHNSVDRHVRDIVRHVDCPQWIWHVAEPAEVLEDPARRSCLVLDREAVDREAGTLGRWLRKQRVGVLHVHSLTRAARARAASLAAPSALPFVATLHDVLFLRPDALNPGTGLEPDRAWLAETAPFLRSARAVLAPSEFIAELARRHVPGLEVSVVPNGSPPRETGAPPVAARPEFATRGFDQVAVVLGAIGPHKGSAVLDEMDAALAGTSIAIVVIGYLDAQVTAGWRNGRVFVHGAYQDRDVPALVRAYGARVALFPNRVPESFSYALSDLWDAGLPALVPDEGALAGRVRSDGGGWILPAGAGALEIAAALKRLLGPGGEAERSRVESQLLRADRVPRLEAMSRSLSALYERYGIDPGPPVDAADEKLQSLLAVNLDGALFRVELARLADELVQVREGLEAERALARRFETESRAWIAKLEGDVAGLQAELAREVEARRAFAEENAKLADTRDAFERLPALLRRVLLKKIRDARS